MGPKGEHIPGSAIPIDQAAKLYKQGKLFQEATMIVSRPKSKQEKEFENTVKQWKK